MPAKSKVSSSLPKRKLMRLKFTGAELVELYLDSILGFRVVFDDDEGRYELQAMLYDSAYEIMHGTIDQCHMALNKIHMCIDAGEEIIEIKL